MFFFFFKQKTAYEMRISDWSSDVCSSDLLNAGKPYSMTQTTAALDGSLPARVTQLHGAIAQLRQAHQKRDETLRFLSHDMRAPQNSILALTQLQQQTQTALPQKEFLQRIDSYADRTLSLVDGFVQLARAEAAPLAHQRLDLVELMAQCCDEFWAQAKQRDIDIHFKQHPDREHTSELQSLMRISYAVFC